jgi:glycosyltransferase involved in cell wall biosynthesis
MLPNKLPENWIDFSQFKEKFRKVPVEEFPNKVKQKIKNPSVTVQIVTYNHVSFIKDALEGVLMQKTNFQFEIILGDDESQDGTREICIEYAKKYPGQIRLMLHKRENNIKILGKPCLIFQYIYNNFSARGKYIAVCSGDDYWTDSLKLQKQFDFLEANPMVNRTYCANRIEITGTKRNHDIKPENLLGEGETSTEMYVNFFQKIPLEYTQVIAEDIFLDVYLTAFGKRKGTPDVEPVVIRRHDNNTYMGIELIELQKQRANTNEKCLSALRIFKSEPDFDMILVSRLFHKNKMLQFAYKRNKVQVAWFLFADFVRHGLLAYLFKYLFKRFSSIVNASAIYP